MQTIFLYSYYNIYKTYVLKYNVYVKLQIYWKEGLH